MRQLAQVVADNSALFTYGPMGVILAWFMWRGEKLATEIRHLSHRIDGMTRAMLADVISRETTGPHTKDLARDMLAKLEREQK